METSLNRETPNQSHSHAEFEPGNEVIYALHGKCLISGIESKKIGTEKILFYKLQLQRPSIARTKRNEPAIWLPVADAAIRGLRKALQKDELDEIFSILSNGEYYFSLESDWKEIQPQLESAVLQEGPQGLAKIEGYLHLLKKKLVVPPPEIARFAEMVHRVLSREIADILEEPLRAVDEKIEKALKQKDRLDN